MSRLYKALPAVMYRVFPSLPPNAMLLRLAATVTLPSLVPDGE